MSQSPPIIARGTYAKMPLAEFLVRALDDRSEGTLIIQTAAGGKHAILFLRGAPAKGRLAEPLVHLGDVLVDLDIVPRAVAVATRKRAQAAKRHHGQVLLDEGHIDQTGLFVALREQLHRQVLHLCDLPEDTVFGLYRANYLADWGPSEQWRVKPLPLVWRALADHLPQARRDLILSQVGDAELRIRFESPVSRYKLNPEEMSIVNLLRAKAQNADEIADCGIGTPERVKQVVCALLLSRQIEIMARHGDPVGQSEPPESPNSVPPPSVDAARRSITAPRTARVPNIPGAPASRRGSTSPRAPTAEPMSARVIALREAIEEWEENQPATYYDMLGVEKDADTSTIQRAFFQLARQWHPDKLPPELADLKGTVNKAFARMGEAHQTLSDDAKRREYDEKLEGILEGVPEGEQAEVAKILDASAAFQKAEVMLKKKDTAAALEEARSAYEGDPTQAAHLALFTWLKALQGEGELSELVDEMTRAHEMQPKNLKILWYRGQLYKKWSKDAAAIRDFKAILRENPKHVEAQRELRVHQMRRRSDPKAGQKAGLLGRLLKKD